MHEDAHGLHRAPGSSQKHPASPKIKPAMLNYPTKDAQRQQVTTDRMAQCKGTSRKLRAHFVPWASVPTALLTRAVLCHQHPQRSWQPEIDCKQISAFIPSK